MSLALLNTSRPNVVHIPLYDLHSFFYVFIWICVAYAGPGKPIEPLPPVLMRWTNQMDTVYECKLAQTSPSVFPKRLATNFSPYFADLVPFATELLPAFQLHLEVPADETAAWIDNVDAHDKVVCLFHEELRRLQLQADDEAQRPQTSEDYAADPQPEEEGMLAGPRRSGRDNTETNKRIQRLFNTRIK